MMGYPAFFAELDRLLETGFARIKRPRSRDERDLRLLHDLPGDDLVAQVPDHLGRGTDEDDARLFAGGRKIRVFREESVAGMDGVGAALLGRPDVLFHVQVVPAGTVADEDGLVGKADEIGLAVGFLVDGHGLETHLHGRADDPQCDLPAICDQDLADPSILRFPRCHRIPSSRHFGRTGASDMLRFFMKVCLYGQPGNLSRALFPGIQNCLDFKSSFGLNGADIN